jgi:hypothetical protein
MNNTSLDSSNSNFKTAETTVKAWVELLVDWEDLEVNTDMEVPVKL